ncbi:MAG TPA: transposase [Candidatus Acidoferrales bacterium]
MSRPRHRTTPGGTYFVTTNTWQRRPLFQNPQFASLLENQIFHYRDRGFFRVHRHVVMPNHFHLLLTPNQDTALEKALQLIKGGFSHELGKSNPVRFPIWRPGFTEHQIRNRTDFDNHVAYIDQNPLRGNLARTLAEYLHGSAAGKFVLDAWPVASGAKAPALDSSC